MQSMVTITLPTLTETTRYTLTSTGREKVLSQYTVGKHASATVLTTTRLVQDLKCQLSQ